MWILEYNVREYLCDFRIGKNFLTKTHKTQNINKSGKYDYVHYSVHQNKPFSDWKKDQQLEGDICKT